MSAPDSTALMQAASTTATASSTPSGFFGGSDCSHIQATRDGAGLTLSQGLGDFPRQVFLNIRHNHPTLGLGDVAFQRLHQGHTHQTTGRGGVVGGGIARAEVEEEGGGGGGGCGVPGPAPRYLLPQAVGQHEEEEAGEGGRQQQGRHHPLQAGEKQQQQQWQQQQCLHGQRSFQRW